MAALLLNTVHLSSNVGAISHTVLNPLWRRHVSSCTCQHCCHFSTTMSHEATLVRKQYVSTIGQKSWYCGCLSGMYRQIFPFDFDFCLTFISVTSILCLPVKLGLPHTAAARVYMSVPASVYEGVGRGNGEWVLVCLIALEGDLFLIDVSSHFSNWL